ncbi:unnamed protein product [Effrenium voratum]|uniref:Uncharacterized protein n=1 Tax=Effrenium voratum TaxID=2562239 RepID=A0AA36NFK8_9DINO|nr:unnamed protein product [Effrenium voratum]CAJ1420507.1 unnamed protein product [Effrenium voratum]CAJ1426325.1 unnamed protein product [Effrenium voratum]CAJ1454844.1 unnamed protein product [Effrenium voratum]
MCRASTFATLVIPARLTPQDDHGLTIRAVLDKFELKHVSVSRFAFLVSAASQNRFGSSCLLLFFEADTLLTSIRRTSTSCTGAFTSELSLAVIERTVNQSGKLARPMNCRASSCHEWNSGCRQLIRDNFEWYKEVSGKCCPMPCVFGNLEDCFPERTYEAADPFIVKFRKVDQAPLFRTQHCFTHDKECALFGAPSAHSDFEVAGLPCWDMSLAGKRLQEEGRTAGAFLAHAKRHVEKETRLIVVENTKVRGKPNIVALLTDRERRVISGLSKEYKARFNEKAETNSNLVIYLGDNECRRCWSAVSGKIPTLRCGGGLLWNPHLKRFMTGREKLSSLGFPVCQASSSAMSVPPLPVLDVKRCSLIAGNAMNFSSVGVVQLVALCSFKIRLPDIDRL